MDAGLSIGIKLELLLSPNGETTRTSKTWSISLKPLWPIAMLPAVLRLKYTMVLMVSMRPTTPRLNGSQWMMPLSKQTKIISVCHTYVFQLFASLLTVTKTTGACVSNP